MSSIPSPTSFSSTPGRGVQLTGGDLLRGFMELQPCRRIANNESTLGRINEQSGRQDVILVYDTVDEMFRWLNVSFKIYLVASLLEIEGTLAMSNSHIEASEVDLWFMDYNSSLWTHKYRIDLPVIDIRRFELGTWLSQVVSQDRDVLVDGFNWQLYYDEKGKDKVVLYNAEIVPPKCFVSPDLGLCRENESVPLPAYIMGLNRWLSAEAVGVHVLVLVARLVIAIRRDQEASWDDNLSRALKESLLLLEQSLRTHRPPRAEKSPTMAEPEQGGAAAFIRDAPFRVVLEIVRRLPTRSVIRLRAVCKPWRDITAHPALLAVLHRLQPPQPLLCFGRAACPNRYIPLRDYCVEALNLRSDKLRSIFRFTDYIVPQLRQVRRR
ncbi:hypothetical protein PR202_gb19587 [Eleusine coracana subsp. coracana]|uniref:F-box domain-containing protein n=1 Tax=Eleusine coracana subsp. coracana TaxID=191504 RepID=A0AAV5F8B3_ELECO|nr:hypothetical protein PR202_gb19587 [Eleusine coracana subsp. coracana]